MPYQSFLSLVDESHQNKRPFVIFKKPNHNEVHLYQQTSDELYFFDENIQENGFLLAPFSEGNTIFIKSDSYFSVAYTKNHTEKLSTSNNILNEKNKDYYCKKLEDTINYIRSGKAEKVVLSRPIDVDIHSFSLGNLFDELIHRYPTAFCYVFYHPKVGIWAAATPETLIKTQGNHIQTMALAGTQPYSSNVPWTQKEIDEQQIVTDTIVQQLKDDIRNLTISETQTIKAGNLAHLCTQIQGEITDENSVFDIVKKLHPTPAVCGFPTQKAKEYIIHNEGYDRAYYSGYCGTIFYKNKFLTLDLFVNLRCMQLFENHARLYVGGGITKDSIPENEWQETQNKALTMLNIIQNLHPDNKN